MKIPKFIKCLAHDVKILRVPRVKYKGEDLNGICMSNSNTIKVATINQRGQILNESNVAEIFWHEITHFISDCMNLNLTEKQVSALAAIQLAVIRDNNLDFRKESK